MKYIPTILEGFFLLALMIGWVANIIWTFNQTALLPMLLGIVGIIVPFVGAIHWFFFI